MKSECTEHGKRDVRALARPNQSVAESAVADSASTARKFGDEISTARVNGVNGKWLALFSLYRLMLPVAVLLSLPFWLRKMIRRGGWGSGLAQKFGCYEIDAEWTQQGRVHVHAVSVGETMIALKLMSAMRATFPDTRFVLGVTTATAQQIAVAAGMDGVEVVYAPVSYTHLTLPTKRIV